MSTRTRLHISPLNPNLLSTILPPAALALASSISYHALQTFPERNYGYVELPIMEAEKVKKKLNGSILRGSKMRVEEARPEKKVRKSEQTDLLDHANEGEVKIAKKRKREDGTLSGYELPEKRKVKRGWTEPAKGLKDHQSSKSGKGKANSEDKKEKKKVKAQLSCFTDRPECLFHTKLPQGVERADESTSGQIKQKRKKSGGSDEYVVVHEFSNTTKHAAFLRDSQATLGNNAVSEFIEEKGWVDRDGIVVEQHVASRRVKPSGGKIEAINEDILTPKVKLPRSSTLAKPEKSEKSKMLPQSEPSTDLDETSSSAISSSSEEDSESEVDDGTSIPKKSLQSKGKDMRFRSLGSVTSPADQSNDENTDSQSDSDSQTDSSSSSENGPEVPSVTVTPTIAATEVHPLEALFKRPKQVSSSTPKKPNLEVQTSFSFFDADAQDQDTVQPIIPQTPFTQRDFQQRRQRSAAPTPDTAAPSKMGFGPVWSDGDEEDDSRNNEDGSQEDQASASTALVQKDHLQEGEEAAPVESEFAKWFWEHRGETNRAWKKRRREAAKEKRQKDNKRRGRSAI
ncbi:hypothetical protein MMC14_001094 [Varicellaria rhodocarpa]|nr:hypothetical protein [Varicellaria rhodocarpa]